jgi:hypothetical protein
MPWYLRKTIQIALANAVHAMTGRMRAKPIAAQASAFARGCHDKPGQDHVTNPDAIHSKHYVKDPSQITYPHQQCT